MLFNGIDLEPYFRIKDIRGRGLIQRQINGVTVPGMPGEHLSSIEEPVKYLEIDIRIVNENLRGTIDELNEIFSTDGPVPIVFPDELDKVYYGTVETSSENGEKFHLNRHDTTFVIRRSDPYKYSPEQSYDLLDESTVYNQGTAEADPIFEMEVLKPVTFAMIQNQNQEYQMIGTPADDDVEVVNTKPLILSERGETLDTWATTGLKVDDYFIDNIAGSLRYDGTGILAQSYGTGNEIHGPAAIKELPSSLQDFEIETVFDTISNFPEDNYRMEIYFFDEGMKMLGKMGINDNNRNFIRRIGLGRVGEYAGANTRYAIGSNRFQRDDLQRVALMYLRVKRVGNKYTFYITEIRNGRHASGVTVEETYTDVAGDYLGRLKYVQLFIGNWQDRNRTFRTRINYINVYELLQETVDQTPYALYPGDLVELNHKDDDILVNGEPRNDLKNFGGSFFKLKKGGNTIIVTPEDSFKTRVKFRDKFR
ncbi:distal tail protein Dit [Oceanobacillus sp. FSL H7-0719]|uniref:distal tail protein Dit n=1 Tax=Oceanobacillus sp. FSL H7-0719 TaxID=2954507 RepID=UPI003250AD58